MSNNSKYLIYALCDPTTLEVRYIGRSSNGLQRPQTHWLVPRFLNDGLYVHNWCKSVLKTGYTPHIAILEQFEYSDNINMILNEAEIKWISYYKERNARLTNMTDGGGGTLGRKLSEEAKQRISNSKIGKKRSIETLIKMSKAASGKKHSDETKTIISFKFKGVKHPFYGKHHTEETKQKISYTKKRKFASGELHNSFLGRKHTEQTKNMLSMAMKGRFSGHNHPMWGKGKSCECINDGMIFSSITAAAAYYKISVYSIIKVCKSKTKKTKDGFMFKYVAVKQTEVNHLKETLEVKKAEEDVG